MNTTTLKTFAPAVRRQLMDAVTRKLDYVLNAQTPDYIVTFKEQVDELRKLNDDARDVLIERVAYTWFNRLTALRYLDARGWHPFRANVLMPASAEETEPEILKLMRSGALPQELHSATNVKRLNDLLDERIPSDDPQGEVYRHLVLAACRFYHSLLPNLFEKLDDATELLLPDDLLTTQSVAQGFRDEITNDDCAEVEVLGWLYQFYISEKKDAVMARKKAVPSEDIPAVTQLFTPHWIVRYLVENSLGRLWMQNRPNSKLRTKMEYYVESERSFDSAQDDTSIRHSRAGGNPGAASTPKSTFQNADDLDSRLRGNDGEQDAKSTFLHIDSPQQIRLLDPAVGSGHMLTYAFDLLFAIYEEEGYAPSEIPALILQHNLYGLEICPRAAALAEMALVFKAREKSRRFFQKDVLVAPRVVTMQDVHFEEGELQEYARAQKLGDAFNDAMIATLESFEHGATFGSLIVPQCSEAEIQRARQAVEEAGIAKNLMLAGTTTKVLLALEMAEMLAQRYHVLAANPPYMGANQMNAALRKFANLLYPKTKSDLFAMFIERGFTLVQPCGYVAMITMQGWMFLATYESMREELLERYSFISMAHLGARAFDSFGGEVVQTTAFICSKYFSPKAEGTYFRLTEGNSESSKAMAFREAIEKPDCGWFYRMCSNEFKKIPGSPIAYWASDSIHDIFNSGTFIKDILETREGLATADNDRFLRKWFEGAFGEIGFGISNEFEATVSNKKWFPYQKGGEYRKWYGNNDYLVNWFNDGEEVKSNIDPTTGRIRSHNYNGTYAFVSGITWSSISSSNCAARFISDGFMFDAKAPMGYGDEKSLMTSLALINSAVGFLMLQILAPTLDFKLGHILNLPLIKSSQINIAILKNAQSCIEISRTDWDSFETSWDFTVSPLLPADKSTYGAASTTVAACFADWESACNARRARLQELEESNNRLFIDAYGLQDELSPEVPDDQITLAKPDRRRDMAALLSYAVGCMMGRYCLDSPGLLQWQVGSDQWSVKKETAVDSGGKLATDHCSLTTSSHFLPDADGVIPILDGEWSSDDVVARTRDFLRAAFGPDHLAENVRFIEDALGKDLRKYFLTDFYKDHLQTYKKRPIYWLAQSPKKGFSCLIYLHRYTRDTMNVVLNRYLREYQHKLQNHINHLQRVATSDATPREKAAAAKEADKLQKVLHECEEWERNTILPLAQARVDLDLDDGVKVNYRKLGDALAVIPGLGKE